MALYPPILDRSQSPFLISDQMIVYFTLSSLSKLDTLKHYQIRISRQDNNKNIVKKSLYPDQIIYKNIDEQFSINAVNGSSNRYYIVINNNDLNEKFQAGVIYKIQMRFGSELYPNNLSNFSDWKSQQIKKNQFSEWSQAMVTKAISAPSIKFINAKSNDENSTLSQAIELTTTPLFQVSYKQNENDKEFLEKYKFDLYKDGEKQYSSDWITYNANEDSVCSYRFNQDLENDKSYSVNFKAITINGYESPEITYSFQCQLYTIPEISNFIISCKEDTKNGSIKLYGSVNNININIEDRAVFTGCYVLSRTDEKSNFSIWKDIKFFLWNEKSFTEKREDLFFTDYIVESGIQYKYAFQKVYSTGYRTQKITNLGYASVNFEHSYIVSKDKQLKLEFDNKISSFKYTVLSSKLDTLGSKYATITRNGNARYAEFPIQGLITMHMDEDNTFFNYVFEKGYYYDNELVIPDRKAYSQGSEYNPSTSRKTYYHSTFDNNLTYDNIFIEKMFRQKVEEFLNDGEYKLYKSPTEGNMVISLTNVSLTPKQELGRAIYSFSATAYEVAENTFDELNKYGISEVGEYRNIGEEEYKYVIGQIAGSFSSDEDFYSMIYNKWNNKFVSESEDYLYNFQGIENLSIEIYPLKSIQQEIMQNKGLKSNLELEQDYKDDQHLYEAEIIKLEQKINILEQLEQKILTSPIDAYKFIVKIDENEIFCKGKTYFENKDIQNSLKVISDLPVIINYIAKVGIKANEEKIPKALYKYNSFGQLYGIFTQNIKNQEFYNPELSGIDYSLTLQTQVPYLVTSNNKELYSTQDIVDENNNLLIPVPMYYTRNIRDIIIEKTLNKMNKVYNTDFIFNQGSAYNIKSKNKLYNTSLSNINKIEIQAPAGTKIMVVGNRGYQQIQVGKTGKLILDNLNQDVNNGIYFITDTWAIINYSCDMIVTEMESITQGGNT